MSVDAINKGICFPAWNAHCLRPSCGDAQQVLPRIPLRLPNRLRAQRKCDELQKVLPQEHGWLR